MMMLDDLCIVGRMGSLNRATSMLFGGRVPGCNFFVFVGSESFKKAHVKPALNSYISIQIPGISRVDRTGHTRCDISEATGPMPAA